VATVRPTEEKSNSEQLKRRIMQKEFRKYATAAYVKIIPAIFINQTRKTLNIRDVYQKIHEIHNITGK